MSGRRKWSLILLCAMLLTAIAIGSGQAQSTSPAAAPRPTNEEKPGDADGAAGRYSVTATTIGADRAIVVVDSQTQRLLVYSVDSRSNPPLLKLVAVRNMAQDTKLEHWNNAHPYPEEIRSGIGEGGAADR